MSDGYELYGEERATEMRKARVREIIRAATARSPHPILNRSVWAGAEAALPFLALATGPETLQYVDVPLATIVALDHKNFSTAPTWRGMLDDLHTYTWDDQAFAYFENELGEALFPADDASGALRLEATGGGIRCLSGQHRLVAAVNWLAANHGDSACLRKASVKRRALNHTAVDALCNLQRTGYSLAIGKTQGMSAFGLNYFIRAEIGADRRHFRICTSGLAEVHTDLAPVAWIRRKLGSLSAHQFVNDWVPIPPTLLPALTNDAWLLPQVATPRYEPHGPCG